MANLKIKSGKLLFVSLLAICLLSSKAFHPYYISVTEIKHKAEEKMLEISCKVFADDMEKALKKSNGVAVNMGSPKDSARVHKLLSDYFAKNLKLNADGQKIKINFLGFEKEQDAIWCYLEASNIKDFKKLCVETTVLYDFAPEQINMIHVIRMGERKSGKLNNPDSLICFEF